jgi:quinol monooxygenase YgiN
MIIVQGWVQLESVDEVERLRAAAVEMMRATKAAEPGCITYAYATDLHEPALLHVIERWRDEAALTEHFATPHMAMFGQAIGEARITAMPVKAYAGEEVRTLMER